MGVIRVDTAQLKARAEELENLNTQFKNAIGELETTENSLNQMWDGDANNAFHAAFNRDKIQMNNFYNAVAQYVVRLRNIVAKYQATEARNVEIGNTRKYNG